jgi:hypothetical protein
VKVFQFLTAVLWLHASTSFGKSSSDLPKASVELSVGGGQPAANVPHARASLPVAER